MAASRTRHPHAPYLGLSIELVANSPNQSVQDYDKANVDQHIGHLKKQGITLTRFYAQTHPSQPNYIAAVAGDYFGLDHDGFVRIPENVSTIVDLLDTRAISWKGYFEDLPGPGYMAEGSDGSSGNGKWDYVRKHKYVSMSPQELGPVILRA